MKKGGIIQTILIVIGVYLVSDLVLFKGFLYYFLQGFFHSMKEQGKMGLVVAFIGLALMIFGFGTCVWLLTGRGFSESVAPEQRARLKVIRMLLGAIIGAFGVYLGYYGLTINQ